MAEAFLKQMGANDFIAESAGLEAGRLNPFAVAAMKELGIDISGNTTNDVNDYLKEGRTYDYVITVCDEANAARCPIFPGNAKKINWAFDDPSGFSGTDAERLEKTRAVRDTIKAAVKDFIATVTR